MADPPEQLNILARHLRDAGETGLRRELDSAIRKAAAPIPREIRAGLRPRLPDRYADVLDADLDLGISTRPFARDPGVLVYARGRGAVERRRLRRLDAGVLEHPLFGNRQRWFTQGEPSVQPGFFTRPAEDSAPRVRDEILAALRRVAEQVTRKG